MIVPANTQPVYGSPPPPPPVYGAGGVGSFPPPLPNCVPVSDAITISAVISGSGSSIESIGGKLTVQSEPGRGSCFTLYFPIG